MRIFHEVKGIPENEEKTQQSRIEMKSEPSEEKMEENQMLPPVVEE